jgi:indole-3-glycerol phosphate synthase
MVNINEGTRIVISEFSGKITKLSQEDVYLMLEAFLTPQELDTLAMRYSLIEKLISGEPQRKIAQELGVSISQISRGSRELQYGAGSKIFPKLFKTEVNILEEILENKKQEMAVLESCIVSNYEFENHIETKNDAFYKIVKNSKKPIIIFEIKTFSPSYGRITQNSVEAIAKEYIKSNVDAISVLTDCKYFNGKISDIQTVRKLTEEVILCKDFIINKNQIKQAKIAGASLVLLIVKALKTEGSLLELFNYAMQIGLECLVEVNNEEELKIATKIGAKIIGVNSRNLETLEIDLNIFQELLPKIPNDICKFALSGISKKEDILKIQHMCDGFLIGSSICSLPLEQISDKVKEFRGL